MRQERIEKMATLQALSARRVAKEKEYMKILEAQPTLVHVLKKKRGA